MGLLKKLTFILLMGASALLVFSCRSNEAVARKHLEKAILRNPDLLKNSTAFVPFLAKVPSMEGTLGAYFIPGDTTDMEDDNIKLRVIVGKDGQLSALYKTKPEDIEGETEFNFRYVQPVQEHKETIFDKIFTSLGVVSALFIILWFLAGRRRKSKNE